jgi:hypothetical protein
MHHAKTAPRHRDILYDIQHLIQSAACRDVGSIRHPIPWERYTGKSMWPGRGFSFRSLELCYSGRALTDGPVHP